MERMQVRAPTHPGAILREDVLPALEMSVTDVAKAAWCVASAGSSDHGGVGAGYARNGVATWQVLRKRAGPVVADASEL